jgi:dihydrofolate synthase/folylpolyglutamate synthase
VLDVGHNPPALEQLIAKLARAYPGRPLRFVLGMSRDKDMSQCLRQLLGATSLRIAHLHLVQASHPRAAPADVMLAAALEIDPGTVAGALAGGKSTRFTAHPLDDHLGALAMSNSVASGTEAAVAAAVGTDEVVVVCGSVFIMSEARELLGFDEPRVSWTKFFAPNALVSSFNAPLIPPFPTLR